MAEIEYSTNSDISGQDAIYTLFYIPPSETSSGFAPIIACPIHFAKSEFVTGHRSF
jgi:hypothetical protein